MKYFLIAGEASGDLHAAHLMMALKQEDAEAEFRCYGGDEMEAAGGELLCHYRHLAYMGFIPVLLHLPTILRGMKRCKEEIADWKPDAVILVDYPGFNLKIAAYVKEKGICPVFYYISPKIWAWKEHRIHAIRRHVDGMFSILPFEKDYFEKKHGYEVSYVGNPTVDEVAEFLRQHSHCEKSEQTIALLPGSRKQEIKDNLSRMLQAVAPLTKDYRVVIAAAPSIPEDFYLQILRNSPLPSEACRLEKGRTYHILHQASVALVTSGTATLETALFRVPQVVCYYIVCGKFVSWLRRHLLKVPFVSLVNLVCGKEVVKELVADSMTPQRVRAALSEILPGEAKREQMLADYETMARILGKPGAPQRAAKEMVERLKGGACSPKISKWGAMK